MLTTTIQDVMFLLTLAVCISLGKHYKKIQDVAMRKSYGTGLGLLIACVMCGDQMVHSVFLVWGNIIIIKCCDKRYVHQVSMAYSWTYLFYLHLNLRTSMYGLWLAQTIALRLVGLAFETHLDFERGSRTACRLSLNQGDLNKIEPSVFDIIAYSYFFIGLHKGPYYRWKVFDDHFNMPFGVMGDCRIITEYKLKKALICAISFMLLNQAYSAEAYSQEEFYKLHDTDSRFLYSVPQLVLYFLQGQVVMLLSTSVCTECGFGVYPAQCAASPGHGPTEEASLLKLASTTADVALQQEYNFAMLKCFDNERLFFGPRMRDTLAAWDMPTQYWFREYMYNLTNGSREVKSAVSFAAWWLWSQPSLHRLIMVATLWLYVFLEGEYFKLFVSQNELMKLPLNLGFSLMRMFCLLYLTPCLVLKDTSTVMKYYNSMFWIYHIILFLHILGLFAVTKLRTATQ